MKKTAKWIFIILILTGIFIACIQIGAWLLFSNTRLWKYSASYEDYADDFNTVKDFIEAEFPNETDKWLFVSNPDGQGRSLFDPDTDEYLQLPSDVRSALDALDKEAFPDKDANFDTIRINEERISFCIENGQYALVYSPNKKPSWLHSPDEAFDVRVKSIKDGWYHVVRDPE